MKISVEDNSIILEEVFSGICLRTEQGEALFICMRDGGFELNYNGKIYSIQSGAIKVLT